MRRRNRGALHSMMGLLCAALLTASAAHAQDDRVSELERKVDVLTQELQNMRLGGATDTAAVNRRTGLGPSASKVYSGRGVSIGGYGEMLLQKFDREREDETLSGLPNSIDFLRSVLYVGYKFNDELLFNSEIELEHAGVSDEAEVAVDPLSGEGEAELSGEVVLEFAYVEWARSRTFGVRGGMLLMPVGLINEMHEPPITIGARRPEVEQAIIPTTWKANGAGVFGEIGERLLYRAYVTEGLNAAHFSAASAIRGGRQGGSQSLLTKPALAARVDWLGPSGLTAGVSGYTGDAWQETQPASGNLEPRVTLFDAHARLEWHGLQVNALYASGTLDDAGALSDAMALTGPARLGERFWGTYVEGAYDVLHRLRPDSRYRLLPYFRYERYDTQDDVAGGAEDPSLERTLVTAGAALMPHSGVTLKLDRQWRSNEADTGTSQWNVALGYAF